MGKGSFCKHMIWVICSLCHVSSSASALSSTVPSSFIYHKPFWQHKLSETTTGDLNKKQIAILFICTEALMDGVLQSESNMRTEVRQLFHFFIMGDLSEDKNLNPILQTGLYKMPCFLCHIIQSSIINNKFFYVAEALIFLVVLRSLGGLKFSPAGHMIPASFSSPQEIHAAFEVHRFPYC